MTGSIQAPARGEKIRASWGAAVTERVNSMSAIGGDVLVRDGATGFGFAPLPPNLRRRKARPSPPGNFEPRFKNVSVTKDGTTRDEIRLDQVGRGFYPFGRLFYSDVTVDDSAKIVRGIIYLEVTYPTPSSTSGTQPSSSSSRTPTATVKGYPYEDAEEEEDAEENESEFEAVAPYFNDSSDVTKSLIPLYEIDSGAILIDFRSAMSLTVREV